MKLKLVTVDFELSTRAKRALKWLALPLAVFAGSVAVARAYETSWIATGQPVSASKLKGNLDEIQTRLAALEQRTGDPDCPTGYLKGTAGTIVLCQKGGDEIVKVGSGPSAFWVDRYEASVWQNADGSGNQYGAGPTSDTYEQAGFLKNGQWTTALYAVSKVGVQPSVNITWFQAAAACRASGKRLPRGEEWLAAARGTKDDSNCNVSTTAARNTGVGSECVSAAGAQDLIGNVWEWTDEWYAGLNDSATGAPTATWPGTGYNGDSTWNITSSALPGGSSTRLVGLPAAGFRGGDFRTAAPAGVFALYLGSTPSSWSVDSGFRCVLPR